MAKNPTKPAAPAGDATPAATAAEKVWVRAVNGPMLNLHTNVWITNDPKKVEMDDFVRAQLEVGKLVVAEE